MKKVFAVLVFVLAATVFAAPMVYAGLVKAYDNTTTMNTTTTYDWGSGYKAVSVSGTFPNRTTARVTVSYSTNDGASYKTFGVYSGLSDLTWNAELIRGSTMGVPTQVRVKYENKSKMTPKKKGNVWLNGE